MPFEPVLAIFVLPVPTFCTSPEIAVPIVEANEITPFFAVIWFALVILEVLTIELNNSSAL